MGFIIEPSGEFLKITHSDLELVGLIAIKNFYMYREYAEFNFATPCCHSLTLIDKRAKKNKMICMKCLEKTREIQLEVDQIDLGEGDNSNAIFQWVQNYTDPLNAVIIADDFREVSNLLRDFAVKRANK